MNESPFQNIENILDVVETTLPAEVIRENLELTPISQDAYPTNFNQFRWVLYLLKCKTRFLP